jgi:hypothetical protein
MENNSGKFVFQMVFCWVPDFNCKCKLESKLWKSQEKINAHRHHQRTSPILTFQTVRKTEEIARFLYAFTFL